MERENANSHCPVPVVVPGPRSSGPGPRPPLVSEQPIISTAPVATASQPNTPTTSHPSTPTAPTPPASVASSPPATDAREEGASPPQSPDHMNLGHNYSPPSPDPRGRRGVTLSVSKRCHMLSRPVGLANYLKSLASEKDKK
ncbi:PREDICTED: leucine-rich repeat extensin-like protein 5 [Nicotiana attenuata]|uniref:leucine-rich repeat extensin-like protein 5 n=1 Tax=Nicotiana attenuata TaxID=49451 RepID=UPI000904FDD0|nr:PREDICTED: leucine-rich repeat extensin-like protein 5 [Nicotiana attenuata]XP_019241303.1 PREDICTED: leucine-rich repeat extensin-like protein 5 [Nicotiana attenuata]